MGGEADWQRMQSALLEEWLKIAGGPPAGGTADVAAFWRDTLAGDQATASGAGPWSAFQLFARTLTAYSTWLKDSRQRASDVTAAVERMLDDLVAGIDVALNARTGMGGKAWPEPAAWPAFGLTREWQKLATTLARAFNDEREAALALQILQWTALRDGAKRMRESLKRTDGPSITSLKALYDHFIDHLEDAFQAQLRSEAYARAFGDHVNAGLKLREATQASMRKSLPLLGVPSMADLESLAQRLGQLERGMRPNAPGARAVDGGARAESAGADEPGAAVEPPPSKPTERGATAASAAAPARAPARNRVAAKSGVRRGTAAAVAQPVATQASGVLTPASKAASPRKPVAGRPGRLEQAAPATGVPPTPRGSTAKARPVQTFDISSIKASKRQKS